MLMYGSSFWRETLRPRAFRIVPMDAAVIPLPIEETTPPVTKTYFGTGTLFYAGAGPSASRFFKQLCVSSGRFVVLARAERLRRSNLGKAVYPYGLIGNCETAALVSTSGAIDWFCYPRFDSPSIFAAILDRQRGGSFRIAPLNPVPTGEQAYIHDTNLLTTTFHRSEGTRAFWVGWLEQCLYHGPFQDAVRRSALVIKLLTYAPTGALCAAPTTSIPEDPGGDRNWDYRYCWLRDASYGIAALFRTGFEQEAVDFINWIRDRAYDHDFAMQILYRVDGDPHLPEQYLEHLAGFEGARPVRLGNRAAGQRELDGFGAVIDCMAVYQRKGGFISTKLWHVIERFADGIWELSREPDNGIWEFQGERKHHTHSKLWCWVALDRAITLAQGTGNTGHVPQWERAAADLRAEIEARAWNSQLGAFAQAYDDGCLDAAVLQMPVLGFLPATDPRMRATIETLSQRLLNGPYVRRYDCRDDQGYLSAAFLLCSFWYVDGLIGMNRLDAAERQLAELIGLSSPLGLLAEGNDPVSASPLGNFPQAYSHLGVIDSAVRLERARAAQPSQPADLQTEEREQVAG